MIPVVAIALVVLVVLVVLAKSVRIVPQERRLIVYRLGRLLGARGPGFVFLIPFIDQATPIDMALQTLECKTGNITGGDGTSTQVTSVIHYRVIDPARAATQVADYRKALATSVETRQRNNTAGRTFTELLGDRAKAQEDLRDELVRIVQPWGIEITDLEIRYVDASEEAGRRRQVPSASK